ncbi:MAG: aldehyde dehydrogenase family protein [Cytophagales bacterium]|nr:aldehyde dehydrogenase family protein [Cytophagales bacterium]
MLWEHSRFNGQRCTAPKILLVHKSIVDEFANTVVARKLQN